MDHAAFLETIAASPDDDAPRLIYADWLDERGDPRSTFIRLQCAIERMDVDDRRRPELEDEAEDLLAAHGQEWAAPLHGQATNWRYRRGFIEHVEAEGDVFLRGVDRWFSALPLRSLRLSLPARLMPDLADCPQLARVEALAFQGHFLRDRELLVLLASLYVGRLNALELAGQGIETNGVRALAESHVMRRLRSLDLRMNAAVGDHAVRALVGTANVAGLRVLNLACTNLTDNGVADLFASRTLPNLRELNVSARGLSDLRPRFDSVAQSSFLQNLSDLSLGKRYLRAAEVRRLLSAAGSLQRLDVAGCGLDADAVEAIATSPQAARLRLLDISRNTAGARGLELVAQSPGLASVTELRAAWGGVRDAGAKALAASPHLVRLTSLDLSGNEIGGPGLKALADAPVVSGLRELDLSYNYVGSVGIDALANSARLGQLRMLKLNANRLTAESAAALMSSPSLNKRLKLETTEPQVDQDAWRTPRPLLGRRA
jgi:uncharacterized protein (TIGR02996 family)